MSASDTLGILSLFGVIVFYIVGTICTVALLGVTGLLLVNVHIVLLLAWVAFAKHENKRH